MQLDLTQGDIKSHMKTLAIPATIGFLFHTLYNVTDTFFAGQISTQALAALSLSFPVFFMVVWKKRTGLDQRAKQIMLSPRVYSQNLNSNTS